MLLVELSATRVARIIYQFHPILLRMVPYPACAAQNLPQLKSNKKDYWKNKRKKDSKSWRVLKTQINQSYHPTESVEKEPAKVHGKGDQRIQGNPEAPVGNSESPDRPEALKKMPVCLHPRLNYNELYIIVICIHYIMYICIHLYNISFFPIASPKKSIQIKDLWMIL